MLGARALRSAARRAAACPRSTAAWLAAGPRVGRVERLRPGGGAPRGWRCFVTSQQHASAREIAEQLQRVEEQKAEAFGRNDFAALPALHEEVERLSALLREKESTARADATERRELEHSQEERLAQLRADAERATSSAQAAVRDQLCALHL